MPICCWSSSNGKQMDPGLQEDVQSLEVETADWSQIREALDAKWWSLDIITRPWELVEEFSGKNILLKTAQLGYDYYLSQTDPKRPSFFLSPFLDSATSVLTLLPDLMSQEGCSSSSHSNSSLGEKSHSVFLKFTESIQGHLIGCNWV